MSCPGGCGGQISMHSFQRQRASQRRVAPGAEIPASERRQNRLDVKARIAATLAAEAQAQFDIQHQTPTEE